MRFHVSQPRAQSSAALMPSGRNLFGSITTNPDAGNFRFELFIVLDILICIDVIAVSHTCTTPNEVTNYLGTLQARAPALFSPHAHT
jgi:hypothetical protein